MNPDPLDADEHEEDSTSSHEEGQAGGQTEQPNGEDSQAELGWIANLIDNLLPKITNQSTSRATGDQPAEGGEFSIPTMFHLAAVN